MHNIYLLLGSNLGDRRFYIEQACSLIAKEIGDIVRSSSFYSTASWGNTELPDFLNLVLQVSTRLSPRKVLESINVIEKALGRERIEKWGSRTIDIDILFYDDDVINEPGLIIPHPLIQERRFALAPMAEIAPDYIHPVLGDKIKVLLSQLSDDLSVLVLRDVTINMSEDTNKTTFEVDLSYLNEIAEGNAEFIIDMIDIFIEQTPVYFDQLSKAIEDKDWKTTGDVAHKIKPTLAFMGVEPAKKLMADIERKARDLDHPEEIAAEFEHFRKTFEPLYPSLQKIREELQGG